MNEIDVGSTPPKDLEAMLSAKEGRLPKSIRKYIRELKSLGRLDEAMRVRRDATERKTKSRQEKIKEELNLTIQRIIVTDDPQVLSENEIRAVWLLSASGILDSKERVEEIQEILSTLDSKSSTLKQWIEERLPKIRDEVLKL